MDRRRQQKWTYTTDEVLDRIRRYIASEQDTNIPGERTIRFRLDEFGRITALHHGGRPGSLL